jgi:hypothetical protein
LELRTDYPAIAFEPVLAIVYMLPISTLKMINRHLESAKKGQIKDPKKYTYMVESLKQIRQMLLIEFKVQNKTWLN